MEYTAFILLVTLLAKSVIGKQLPSNECTGVLCPAGRVCVPDPKQCFTTPCDQYSCVSQQDLDPCFSSPCPAGQNCISEKKQCVTQPCYQFRCEPNPCQTIRCSSGFHCVTVKKCSSQGCESIGRCENDLSNGTGNQGRSCPSTDGVVSNCIAENCAKTGCQDGMICCPKACGGTSCQMPVKKIN